MYIYCSKFCSNYSNCAFYMVRVAESSGMNGCEEFDIFKVLLKISGKVLLLGNI